MANGLKESDRGKLESIPSTQLPSWKKYFETFSEPTSLRIDS